MERREDLWRSRWEKTLSRGNRISLWDCEYELVYSFLTSENAIAIGKTCLETGSGTGRMSIRIAKDGAKPILFDVSKKAIEFSKTLATINHVEADFVVGSILNLPFKASCVDIVWSAGVLEHFTPDQQQTIVHESLRVLKHRGKLIATVPHREARIYNFFRVLSQKIKTWPYGYEEPLTVEDFQKFSPRPAAFHSNGWLFTQFSHVFLPGFVSMPIRTIKGRLLYFLEIVLKSYYIAIEKRRPGLFLAAVWVK